MSTLNRLLHSLTDALLRESRRLQQPRPAPPKPKPPASGRSQSRPSGGRRPAGPPPPETSGYPGDFTGVPTLSYDPQDDPGEIVWAWVPYEEDHSQGKDRPVLVIGHDAAWLLALPMTSKDHDRDARQEASVGRYWYDIGSGPWDREGRPSEVRVNRILRVDPGGIRRIAARLDYQRFQDVAREVLRHYR